MPARPLPIRAIARSAFLVAFVGLAIGLVGALPNVDVPTSGQDGAPLQLDPFMPAPPFTLPTSAGIVSFGGASDHSTVFLTNNPLGSTAPSIWGGDVGKLLSQSPDDARYVVMSYGETQAGVDADIAAFQARVEAALAARPPSEDPAVWRSRFTYVDANPLTVGGAAPAVLRAWGETAAEISVGDNPFSTTIRTAGTTDTGWATPLTDTVMYELSDFGGTGLACNGEAPASPITGTMVVVKRGVCPLVDKINNVARFGAAGMLMYSDGRPKIRLPNTCGPCPKMHVAMIDLAPGEQILAALRAATETGLVATLDPKPLGVDTFAIDHKGRMREFGSIPFGFNADLGADAIDPLASVALEARLLHHNATVDARLAAEEASGKTRVVPVWQDEWMADPGWSGQRFYADVALPDAAEMARYDKLEIDLDMKCDGGNRKGRCPAWDYLVNMYLCDAATPSRCNTEFGRWVTAYSSGGRWVMDATPLLGLIAQGGTRRFAFATIQRYQITVKLRLSDTGAAIAPKAAVPLFGGGSFWKDYNKGRRPLVFDAPAWASKVEVASILSGHGWGRDMENCAEFCNHTHHFTVNDGPSHIKAHPSAGTNVGCVAEVDNGVIPNQAGTWVYGRGGWCPGQDVPPWRADVTADVRPGEPNTIRYRGLWRTKDKDGNEIDVDYVAVPNPDAADQGFDARIDQSSWLVYYGPKDLVIDPATVPLPRQARVWLPALLVGYDWGAGR